MNLALFELIETYLLCGEGVFSRRVVLTSLLYPFSVLRCANVKYAILFLGLDVDGIYRVSGNLATIQKLRFIVNQGK